MGFKRNVILVTAAAATVLLGTVLGAAETPRYPVYPLERAPDLDGTVDGDPAWAGLPQGVGFHVLGGRSAAPDETSFRMAFTDKALYVAFVCKEPDVTNVAAISKDGGSAIWREDGVEAFILPRGAAEIFQVVVNAAGARINYRLDAGDPEMVGAAPLAASRAAAFKGDDFYSIEIEIPFESLGRTPGDGDVWTGNLCRNVNLGPDHTNENFSWAHTISRYCEPGRFAQFVFHRERPATGEKDVDALASGGDDAELHLVVSLSFDDTEGETLLVALDVAGVAVSSGSACTAGSLEPSHVLLAMGLPRARARAALRLSVGPGTTEADVDRVLAVLPAAVAEVRAMAP